MRRTRESLRRDMVHALSDGALSTADWRRRVGYLSGSTLFTAVVRDLESEGLIHRGKVQSQYRYGAPRVMNSLTEAGAAAAERTGDGVSVSQ